MDSASIVVVVAAAQTLGLAWVAAWQARAAYTLRVHERTSAVAALESATPEEGVVLDTLASVRDGRSYPG